MCHPWPISYKAFKLPLQLPFYKKDDISVFIFHTHIYYSLITFYQLKLSRINFDSMIESNIDNYIVFQNF